MPDANTNHDVAARRRVRRVELAAVVAVSLVATVPFCNKAFHIDDPLYMNIAEQILLNPSRPFDGLINWQQVTEPAWNVSISPPGFSYWLAFWMTLGVRGEIGLHVVGAFWTVLLGVATYFWADRLAAREPHVPAEPLGRWPVAAAVIVVTSPLVVAGQNLMLDVPMLALATSAVVVYFAASDRNSIALAVSAGMLAGVSANVKYAGVVATAVMGCDAILFRRWRMLASAAVGATLLVVGQWFWVSAGGTPHIVHARLWIASRWPTGWPEVVHRTCSAVNYLGSCAVWLVLLAPFLMRRPVQLVALVLASAVGAACAVFDVRMNEADAGVATLAHAAVFAFNGLLAGGWTISEFVRFSWRMIRSRGDGGDWNSTHVRHIVALAVWTAGFWYLGVLNGPFVAPRALLPCLLGCVLVLTALAPAVGSIGRNVFRGGVWLGAIIGMSIGAADYGWAGIYRDAAPQLAARYRPASGTLYFLGHWGWQHYAAASSMTQFDPSRMRFRPGDVVILPANVDCPLPLDVALRGCREIERERVPSVGWLPRTRNPSGAVFLHGDTTRGRIPWGWSGRDAPIEEFIVLRYGD